MSIDSMSDGASVESGLVVVIVVKLGSEDRKSTRLNSSHSQISYAVFCLKKKNRALLTSACSYCFSWEPMQILPRTAMAVLIDRRVRRGLRSRTGSETRREHLHA